MAFLCWIIPSLSLFWVVGSMPTPVFDYCPESQAIAPCVCEPSAMRVGYALKCSEVSSDVEVDRIVQATRAYNVVEFVLSNSHLRFFKHDTFQGTQIQRIYINQTSLLALTDTQMAFAGLEEQLNVLEVEGTSFVSHWNCHHLKQLRNLTSFSIKSSDLIYIASSLQQISPNTLKRINLSKNGVAAAADNAFSPFNELVSLNLGYNELEHFERSLFPSSATKLVTLDLSYNMVKNLPVDLFSDMPALKFLHLSGNKLHYLNEQVFQNVWGQLTTFNLTDVPLLCDCRLTWITKVEKKPYRVNATCAEPSHVKGMSISSLTSRDLWCY